MFEAQCRALEISEEPNKRTWWDVLLVTTADDAFATILADLNENNAISYEAVKTRLTEKYSGEEYKRHLENKLRNLKFRAGTKIPEFLHELRTTIRDYYGHTHKKWKDSMETWAILIEIFFILIFIYRAAQNTGDDFKNKKKIAFPEGNKLFAGDFRANLDETNSDMVQFTKRWNWELIV